jgi:uroporphyrinogen III methyltransferase / synthase
MSARPGTVYLVGAGPGDPGLITRRGLELLRTCDVVLYDRLVSPDLLHEAPAHAERVFVGKRPGETHSRQVVSDALLVSKAREGKSVVRLKGGDPFVFGRGAEEGLLLRAADIPFEVVPGVSSAVAVPAYAGIPVTHRGLASSFVVLTGREESEEPDPGGPLTVTADTMVLLMGVSALEVATRRLIEAGRPADEPAATIEWGTTGKQRVLVADLGTIAERARAQGFSPPSTTVIGRVVELRAQLAWFEVRPLLGYRIVITRPIGQSVELASWLTELGADVVRLPLVDIGEPSSLGPLQAAADALAAGNYEWVLFASTNAVARFFDQLALLKLDARAFAGTKIGAVGRETARALEDRSVRADLVPERSTAAELVARLGPGTGKVLFPRVEGGPREAVDALIAQGWEVDDVPAYSNVPAAPDPTQVELVRGGHVDIVTFTSASTARNFVQLVGRPEELERVPRFVCIGPSTAAAASEMGLEVAAIAEPHDAEGLVAAVLSVAAHT